MALSLKLKKGATASDMSYFIVEDNTGVYDATTNPTGYGTPNTERAALALYVYGFKYHATPDTDTALAITNNEDPENASSWQVAMDEDGYHYLRVLGFNIWSNLVTYAIGDLVYYQTKYYQATAETLDQDPINNTTIWTEVTDLTTEAIYENTSLLVYQLDVSIDSRGRSCYQTQLFKQAKDNCGCSGDQPGAVVQPYMKIFVHLNAARILCLQEKYIMADAELKYLSEYCESIGCGC
jgi:hypothetical protein